MTDLMAMADHRIEEVRAEWHAFAQPPPLDLERFAAVKADADDLVDRGLWTSGPGDMLSVLGRQRDELIHSRLIAWLLVPTNRHGLGLTATSDPARSVWRAMSYRELHDIISNAIEGAQMDSSIGRATALQYLSSLNRAYGR
jgi:hypothetical protein